MSWDWEEIKNKAQEFMSDAERKIKQYTPEAWSKEKQFINAIVTSMVLMVVADKEVETKEVLTSMDTINEIDQIKELNMQQEAIELFELHLERLEKVLANDVKFTIEVAKLLNDIARIKDYPEYLPMIKNLLDYLAQSDGSTSNSENEMKEKILKTLS